MPLQTPSDYFTSIAKPYNSLDAQSALNDQSILSLCDSIILDSPKLLIDFGCGQGRLLAALKHTKKDHELVNLHYIGIDADSASLNKCESAFKEQNFPNGARASFLTYDQFTLYNHYLADYIVIVFTIHEMDFLKLDYDLASLWQILRQGGTLLIQDSYAPIHKEIEFICFSPQDIKTIMSQCPNVQINSLTAGKKHNVEVYTILLIKNIFDYRFHSLTDSYLNALNHSIIRDACKMYEMREKVESGGDVDINEYAPLVHRVAVKAKAYHQVNTFNLLNRDKLDYCMFCGSTTIKIDKEFIEDELSPNANSGVIWRFKCLECGRLGDYYVESGRDKVIADSNLVNFYRFLDRGKNFHPEYILCRSWLHEFFSYNEGIIDTIEFLLDRIPGIDKSIIADAKSM